MLYKGPGTFLVMLYQDPWAHSWHTCMNFGYRHLVNRKCPTSFGIDPRSPYKMGAIRGAVLRLYTLENRFLFHFTVFKMSIFHFTVLFIVLMVFSISELKNSHFTFYIFHSASEMCCFHFTGLLIFLVLRLYINFYKLPLPWVSVSPWQPVQLDRSLFLVVR